MACSKVKKIFECYPENTFYFKGPFFNIVTENLIIKNLINQPIIFKIKSTNPEFFSIKPDSEIIEASCFKKVIIKFLSTDVLMKKNKILEFNNYIKFIVQVTLISNIKNDADLFNNVDPSNIIEQKFSCFFDSSEENPDDFENLNNRNSIACFYFKQVENSFVSIKENLTQVVTDLTKITDNLEYLSLIVRNRNN